MKKTAFLKRCLVLVVFLPVSFLRGALEDVGTFSIDFDLSEARFDDQGHLTGHQAIPDVKIGFQPAGWQGDGWNRVGFSKLSEDGLSSRVENLFVNMESMLELGDSSGHLKLLGNQPWGAPGKYFLWPHGWPEDDAGPGAAFDAGNPLSCIVLVPVEHRERYCRLAVLTFKAPQDTCHDYFESLVADMLKVSLAPEGEPAAKSFDEQRQQIIQSAAAYWRVGPDEMLSGFSRWQLALAALPLGERVRGKILLSAYLGNLAGALEGAGEVEDWLGHRLNMGLNVALGRDLLAKAGEVPQGLALNQAACAAFKRALEYSAILQRMEDAPLSSSVESSLKRIVEYWEVTGQSPSPDMRFFIQPSFGK